MPYDNMVAAPIPLPDWIRKARFSLSEEDYLTSAITVAYELTTFLSIIVDGVKNDHDHNDYSGSNFIDFSSSWNDSDCLDFISLSEDEEFKGVSSNTTVQLEDIVTENVLVSMNSLDSFIAKEVKVKQCDDSQKNTTPRQLCYAIGNIFFELFSQGDPVPLIDFNEHKDSFGDLIDLHLGGDVEVGEEHVESIAARASKRANVGAPSDATSANNSSPLLSSKATFFLQEQGAPISICQLVSDLLENDEGNVYISDTALSSLDEVRSDLKRMHSHPHRFLYDKTCPNEALHHTGLFNNIDGERVYGREKEICDIMGAAMRVSLHVPTSCGISTGEQQVGGSILCEAAFLSGHSGIGKSCIAKEIVSHCQKSNWAVLVCKFDRQISPLSAFLQCLDAYFERFLVPQTDPSIQEIFHRISHSLRSRVDLKSFGQLCLLLPSFRKLFPMPMNYDQGQAETESYVDHLMRVSSQAHSRHQLHYLFSIIFQALCSGGHPVLICLEDLQWSDATMVDIIGDFIQSSGYATPDESVQCGGLFYLGNFRDNEVDEDGFLMKHINCITQALNISVGELAPCDINKMISFNFCLPSRHTRELAELVYLKTRGHPLFTNEFLKSIVQKKIVLFSVKARRWVWDDVALDMQQISEGVVELLMEKLKQLPKDVVEALKVASCFGYQINISTIQRLRNLRPNMLVALEAAVKEGIVEKAGPLFAFSHDMIRETTYGLIEDQERSPLHKKIGMNLVMEGIDVAKNAELCALAVDQINLCKDLDGMLIIEEKAVFARLNLVAGEHSLHASSYGQARGYFEAGISLVESIDGHWDTMYDLSLRLFEMSTVASFMDGHSDCVSGRLKEVLANVKSFDDSLNARAMLAKLYVSQEMVGEGVTCVLEILSHLQEDFPLEIDLAMVLAEMKSTRATLNGITKEHIQHLPAMADGQKKKTMTYMRLLSESSVYYSPSLVMLLSCRMIKSTFQFGFCEDFSQALITFAHGLIQYLDDFELAKRMAKIGEFLMQKSPNQHSLRARTTIMLTGVNTYFEPAQATLDNILNGYRSAVSVGDLDSALAMMIIHCIGSLNCCTNLEATQRNIIKLMHDMTKHKRTGMLHSTMSCFNLSNALIGDENSCTPGSIEIKTNDELKAIAERTQNSFLMHHVLMNEMYIMCYFRNHRAVAELAVMHDATKQKGKRALDILPKFFEGLSSLSLARQTKDNKWRAIGEKAVELVARVATHGTWTFTNKYLLLQAELYYLDERHSLAEITYTAAIVAAQEHKFLHEEALTYEMYGIYLVETTQREKGLKQLEIAMTKYKKWGALKKAQDVNDFIGILKVGLVTWPLPV